ncbi:nucleotidyltransferase domain-containing protein [Salinibacterium sp. TMP30]|uniref:nucleotidyltransferase domain-containing protein n=1 Tax=Salinibacterium sp. TMP30 TaxID=3138237 RepID=UPI003139C7BF
MRLQNPFSAISTTGIDSQVLSVLVRTEQHLTIREIHQLLPEDGSHQGVRLSVARLVEQGVVMQRITGRGHAFAFNREHLLAGAIVQIADAKRELIVRMVHTISGWQFQPLTVTLFGSAARNEMRTDSDIDVLVVVPDSAADEAVEESVQQFAAQVTVWTGNDVRPLVYRDSEVQPAAIFDSVLSEGVEIAGDHSWLRKRLRSS